MKSINRNGAESQPPIRCVIMKQPSAQGAGTCTRSDSGVAAAAGGGLSVNNRRRAGAAGCDGPTAAGCCWRVAAAAAAALAAGMMEASPPRCCPGAAAAAGPKAFCGGPSPAWPPPPPIDAPCTQCLRHGDPMHAHERLTVAAAAAGQTHLLLAVARIGGGHALACAHGSGSSSPTGCPLRQQRAGVGETRAGGLA
eukprot:COSAG01_NODE_2417_length_7736_cov_7.862511_3_plen_196_part_00